ncbi:MAG: hypothetical protein GY768_09455 [Planctomycetaceae bacterium]|nr:hypothetical protein [Planctomycetaceae bacterium]
MQWTTCKIAGLMILASLATGCVSISSQDCAISRGEKNQVERGRPNFFVDTAGDAFSIPSKVLLWNRKVGNRDVSFKTENELGRYMFDNELESTKVRLNQYAPIDEWRRLVENKSVPAIARYTFGTLHNVGYTLIPGRIFGDDKYNPYTDTLSVYSDVPSIAMTEVAYAKDIRSRKHPGWYVVGQEFPVLGILHETYATQDALNYLAMDDDPDSRSEATRVLYPRYGSSVGGNIGGMWSEGDAALTIAGAVVGHIAGRRSANQTAEVSYHSADSNTLEKSTPD